MATEELELKLNYDAKSDVLYLSFGSPRDALSVEENDGLIVRHDPQTDEVVGITIVNFKKRFAKDPGQVLSLSGRRLIRTGVNL
jgi:uncharacterized protein YuzE